MCYTVKQISAVVPSQTFVLAYPKDPAPKERNLHTRRLDIKPVNFGKSYRVPAVGKSDKIVYLRCRRMRE